MLSKESEQQLILFFRHLTSFSGGNLKEITAKSRVRQLRKICIALEVELLDLIRQSNRIEVILQLLNAFSCM